MMIPFDSDGDGVTAGPGRASTVTADSESRSRSPDPSLDLPDRDWQWRARRPPDRARPRGIADLPQARRPASPCLDTPRPDSADGPPARA